MIGRPIPLRLRFAIFTLAVAAVVVFAIAIVRSPVPRDGGLALQAALLFALILLARRFPVRLAARIKMSVGTAPLFAAALLLPTPVGILAAGLAVAIGDTARGSRWFNTVFSSAEVALRVAAGAAVFDLMAGSTGLTALSPGRWLLAAPLAAATMYVTNELLVDLMVGIQLRRSPLVDIWNRRRLDLPQEGSLFLLGLLVAMVGVSAPWAIALLAVPLLMVHQSLCNAMALREREVLRIREEVLASVSHDLRSPITAIKTFAQLLRQRALRSGLSESDLLVEGLTTIDANATKMESVVSELVNIAHIEAGRSLDLSRESVDLVALVRGEIDRFGHTTPGHTIELQAQPSDVVGLWDSARLERVVDNLLSNAVKYSPNGGRILVTVAQRQMPTPNHAEVTVQDSGVGIPTADLPHIFQRFHRGGNVVGRFAGSGLGLAGAKQIIEQHGGSIAVDSTEGAGTTVTVRLPLMPAGQPTTDAAKRLIGRAARVQFKKRSTKQVRG